MAWQEAFYTTPPVLAAGALFMSALYVWLLYRQEARAKTGVLLMLACAEWLMAYAVELNASDVATKLLWAKMQFPGLVLLPLLWWVYTQQFTHSDTRRSRRNVALASVVPAATLALVFTNETHGLIWSNVQLSADGPFTAL